MANCPDAAGSFNNTGGNGLPSTPTAPVNPYKPAEFCVGTFTITQGDCAGTENTYQEQLAAQALSISGAPVNVFKLLGVHEQGRLVDLTGNGEAIGPGSPGNAFDSLAPAWTSPEAGLNVLNRPSFIGYDFGVRKTSFNLPENAPGIGDAQHITSFKIQQTVSTGRALQVRIERSDGNFSVNPLNIQFTGAGNGTVQNYIQGAETRPGYFTLIANTPTQFSVMFSETSGTTPVGLATVNKQFNSLQGSFTVVSGSTPFIAGDMFTVPLDMEWKRVDIVNLPNYDAVTPLIRVKQSAPSRYWRLVPTSFTGVSTNTPWVVDTVQFFDYQQTSLDDVQDGLFMENRDRDYASASLQVKAAYQPFDAVSDLSKFGFQMADIYSFTISFAEMVRTLGRPIVVGDVLELPSEVQYDQHLRPVRKFLEVSDTGWSAEGFTTGWKPIIFRFQAQQLIPSQEHRDILGTVQTQKYSIDDVTFMNGIEQISTLPLTVSEQNNAEAVQSVPEKGTNVREEASGTNRFSAPGTYDGVGLYVEDGLPPDGHTYTEGFKLPDVAGQVDGAFFRLNYAPDTKIPARLYKFSGVKNKWIYVETDRRSERSAHTPSQLSILNLSTQQSLTSKKI